MKTYLNGVHIRGLLTIRTLAAKLLGIVFAIGAGVIAGKEGPFVVRPEGSGTSSVLVVIPGDILHYLASSCARRYSTLGRSFWGDLSGRINLRLQAL